MLAPTHIFFSSHGLTVLCALSSFIAVYKSALVSQKMLFWLLLGALVAYLYFSMYSKTRHLPPGPVPLPLIGNLHQLILGTIKHKGVVAVLREWKKKYGDVHTFWLGPVPTVNICDYQLAHDAMIKKGSNFADRFYLYLFDIVRDGKGVIFSSGSTWTEQRRFSLHTLRNFGLGRNVMEDRIMLEYDYRSNLLNKEIEKAGGKLDTDPYHWIELSVGNVINRLLFTERFLEDEEKEFFRLKENLDRLIGQGSMLDLLLSKRNSEWPILKQHKEKKLKPLWEIVHFIRSQVEKRKADIASGEHEIRDNGEDFVDAFLLEMQKSDHAESFTEGDLVTTVLDLWLAGQETTTTTLQWAFGLLVRNPDVIQKIQEELDRVTGQNRSLKLSDKAETPYLNAVVLEVLRVSMLVPMNMWRKAHEDVVVGQFHIPKGTAITAQLSVIMSDQDTFEDALKFNPSRFIENNHLEQYVVPFGMGKRACLGESLARAELYLILGNFVLDYDIAPNLQHYPDIQAANELGAVRKSKPYRLLLSKRI